MTLNRKKLADTRLGLTHHVEIADKKGPVDIYISTGVYPCGVLGELFIEGRIKEIGVYDDWATASSLLFQVGFDLDAWVKKFAFIRRPPRGMCKGDSRIRSCSSITDYIARWIGLHYGSDELKQWLIGGKKNG